MPINLNGLSINANDGNLNLAGGVYLTPLGHLRVPAFPSMSGRNTTITAPQNTSSWYVSTLDVNSGAWDGSFNFVVPVAGVYGTAICGIIQGGASDTATTATIGYGGPVKNGVLQNFFASQTNDDWTTFNHVAFIDCAVGDTLRWAINSAPSPVGNSAGIYSYEHNNALIWFVG